MGWLLFSNANQIKLTDDMKMSLISIYLVLFPILAYGQKVYCNDYDSYNGISLLLYSNGTFILSSFSPESQYDPDDLPDLTPPPVIWLEGEWTLHD